jgi:hypothetical protein
LYRDGKKLLPARSLLKCKYSGEVRMPGSTPVNDQNERNAASAMPFPSLRRFTQQRDGARAPAEHCELCSEAIPSEHRHLLDLQARNVLCACNACALLFGDKGSGAGKYRLIPKRCLALTNFQMSDEQWDELMIPVNMVYMFHDSASGRVMAYYPSPVGATESLLDLHHWEDLLAVNPVLDDLEADVEALLINRVRNSREHYIVPIDTCFKLVGLMRLSWRGLSGGQEVWQAIEAYFADLRAKAQPVDARGGPGDAGFEL